MRGARGRGNRPLDDEAPEQTPDGAPMYAHREGRPPRARRSLVRFVVAYPVYLLAGGLVYVSCSNAASFRRFLEGIAFLGFLVLKGLGLEVTRDGTHISGSIFAVDVSQECSAFLPSACYAAAVLAWPAPVLSRLAGLVGGLLAIQVVNVVRVVTLYLAGTYDEELFRLLHERVWEAALVVFIVVLWLGWRRLDAASRAQDLEAPMGS